MINLIEYRPKLIMIAYKYTHNLLLAEDFADQALGNAYSNLSKWRGDNLQSWLHSIVLNICRHWTRDLRRDEAALPDLWKKYSRGRSPAQDAVNNEIREAIDAAFDRLTQKQRDVFKMAEVDGLPFKDVAERLGIRCGAARALAFRARAVLARELGKFVA